MTLQVVGSSGEVLCWKTTVGLGIALIQEAVDGQIPMNQLALKNIALRHIAEKTNSHHTRADVA